MKYIDIKEFKDSGFLQEVNRQFLHPFGMALEVHVKSDGSYELSGIQDFRDDVEGVVFNMDNLIVMENIKRVFLERMKREPFRVKAIGSWVQTL